MQFYKEYIIQILNTASNNLRLRSGKLESVILLKRFFQESKDLEYDIYRMKKLTEFSRFAIKLGEIYNYIINDRVDFLTLSDRFKEQSHKILDPLSDFLNSTGSERVNELLIRMRTDDEAAGLKTKNEEFDTSPEENKKKVVEGIKRFNEYLDQLERGEAIDKTKYRELSVLKQQTVRAGYTLVPEIYDIVREGLFYLEKEDKKNYFSVVEDIRACLIVAVAIIRDKEANITDYLKKTESFARKLRKVN